jgi:hypothetical protein
MNDITKLYTLEYEIHKGNVNHLTSIINKFTLKELYKKI